MWIRVFLYKYIQSKLLKIQKISILIMKNTECAMIFNTSRISSFLRTFIRYENFMYFISKHVGVTRAIIWATSSRSISNGREMTFAYRLLGFHVLSVTIRGYAHLRGRARGASTIPDSSAVAVTLFLEFKLGCCMDGPRRHSDSASRAVYTIEYSVASISVSDVSDERCSQLCTLFRTRSLVRGRMRYRSPRRYITCVCIGISINIVAAGRAT